MALGVSQLGLRHAEVVSAVTVNAAAALGLAADRGQIASGFRADLVSWSVSDWREVAYWMGGQLVNAVWTGGSACPLPAGAPFFRVPVKNLESKREGPGRKEEGRVGEKGGNPGWAGH